MGGAESCIGLTIHQVPKPWSSQNASQEEICQTLGKGEWLISFNSKTSTSYFLGRGIIFSFFEKGSLIVQVVPELTIQARLASNSCSLCSLPVLGQQVFLSQGQH